MNRNDINTNYSPDARGRITAPGKFEAEMLYVPYLWNVVLEDGETDARWEEELCIATVSITDTDRKEFPELGDATEAELWESEQGFVYCTLISPTD